MRDAWPPRGVGRGGTGHTESAIGVMGRIGCPHGDQASRRTGGKSMRDLACQFASETAPRRRSLVRAGLMTGLLGVVVMLTAAGSALADGVTRNHSSSGTSRFLSAPLGVEGLEFPELRGGEE